MVLPPSPIILMNRIQPTDRSSARCLFAILGRTFFLSALWLVPTAAGAQAPEVHPLWADGAPLAGGAEVGDVPRIELYRVESEALTPAILILPGGGYGNLATGHEGLEIAQYFNSLGITAAVCIYRHRGLGNGGAGYGHPVPLLDASRGLRTLRAYCEAWNIDPNRIGIIGFSAGGHLASTVSTRFDGGDPESSDPIEQVSSRPDFCVLGYPVISFGKPHTHRGSQRNLLGDDPDPELVRSLSNEGAVTEQTPPTFLFHTAEDKAVPAENSLVYASTLMRVGVPTELHVFEAGRHGLGLAANQPGMNAWPKLCAQWLQQRGVIAN